MKDQIKKIISDHDLQPNKRMGQNFLINRFILKSIVQASDIGKDDIVLEAGPGLGILTKELAKKAKKVIAIEKDTSFIPVLKEELKEYDNVEIIQGDILKVEKLPLKYIITANLPYYLTSNFIRKFLKAENQPQRIILMVQKEVAQRICAEKTKMNLLSTLVQFYGKPKIIRSVPSSAFWPRPEVDSAIIKISEIKKPEVNEKDFITLIKAGFSTPRKKLVNNINSVLKIDKDKLKEILTKLKINPDIRAEKLSISQWIEILNDLSI